MKNNFWKTAWRVFWKVFCFCFNVFSILVTPLAYLLEKLHSPFGLFLYIMIAITYFFVR